MADAQHEDSSTFRQSVRRRGGVGILSLCGELDIASAGRLDGTTMDDVGTVVVDVSRVTFIDLTGLDALRGLIDGLRERGCAVRVGRPSTRVARHLRLLAEAGERSS